jgi:hypothetical protein
VQPWKKPGFLTRLQPGLTDYTPYFKYNNPDPEQAPVP